MRRSGSFQLARIFGIRIGVSASWFFVLFFFIYVLSGYFRDLLGSGTEGYVVAVASALLFFTSLVLHELGHAVVARRLGLEIEGVDLWFFGGLAKMRGETRTPGAEFLIAVAGPLVTLIVVAAACAVGVALSTPENFWNLILLSSGAHATAGLVLLSWLATINALVLVFNLIPALPLDGGRLALAVAWRLTGDRGRGTRAAAQAGRVFAMLLGGLGLGILASGYVSSGLWAMVVALFLYQAARGAIVQSKLSERIRALTVADIMDREPVTIPAATSLLEAQEEFFLRYRWPWFAVVSEDGHYVGLLRAERLDAELRDGRPALTAADVSDDEPPWRIGVTESLESLLGSEGLRGLGAVVALEPDGRLAGVVTLTQVRRALAPATGV
ncbi:MAG: site-2 protease family protein [Solirubrobacteraceae bacterium]